MASYSNRLIYFNIKCLSHRRLISDMVLTYKILNGLMDVEAHLYCIPISATAEAL